MANGTIAFDTLSTSGQISGTAKSVDTDYLASGSVKVWCTGAADGTSIIGSFNVSSMDDVATGKQRVNFSTALGNNLYCTNMSNSGGTTKFIGAGITNETLTTSQMVFGFNADDSGASDCQMATSIHGELT